jgi:sugar phosphate permease
MNRRSALVNLVFCSVMHGLNHYLIIFFKPMYPMMTDHFGLTNVAEITTRMTIIYLGYGISNFVSGLLSRRFSQKLILFFGMG